LGEIDTTMSTSTVEQVVPAKLKPVAAPRFFADLADARPIRAELFGLEHLESHARELAAASPVLAGKSAGHPLLRRFVENGHRLSRAHEQIVEATQRQESLAPDAEWLLDNFHIVVDTLREVRHDLPRGYYKELPKLAGGPLAGFPRVYAVALELIAHTDSSLDEGNISRFVGAFQTVAPLSIGELWAVPIMLRLSLVENLRRLAEQMLQAWGHRRDAETCCGELVKLKEPGKQAERHTSLASFWRPHALGFDAFVVRLLQALRDHGREASAIIDWLETHFSASGASPVEVLRREHQRQAANQVSVGNCVTSLRFLSALDWTVLFERMSLVEAALHGDPAGIYARQDFATKDRYRQAVEKLTRGSQLDELGVVRRTLELARREVSLNGEPVRAASAEAPRGAAAADAWVQRRRHVGYYLIGPGRKELAAAISFRPTVKQRFLDTVLEHPNAVYFCSLGLVFAALVAGLAFYLGSTSWGVAAALILAALVPLSDLSVGLVHYLLTLLLRPRVLPKMDFKEGIPADCATFVVMPTMLLRPESAKTLTDRLEVHFLSNPDAQLRFALLTDFADSQVEATPEDQEYLRAALDCIKTLNERYPLPAPPGTSAGSTERFFIFHRRRVWNPVQGCWMGWERKRGKLAEFNRLLRGDRNTSFAWTNADLKQMPSVRFVITLDADTELPRETAQRLVGTLAHPLNRPHFDAAQYRVVEGYGVLQPRVTLSLVAAMRSRFSRILTSSAGIDPYTTAVSDVYQDLFGSGSFTGKGIYDVDAFEAATSHTFPDNCILSHDLIEGNFARCGLVTDIELIDDFPSRYNAYARREHRWIRGDWQLLPWLLRQVPVAKKTAEQGARKNTLPALERWKIIDNLRRSLLPPTLTLMLVLGWLLHDGPAWFWTVLGLVVLAVPLLITLADGMLGIARGGALWLQLRDLWQRLKATAAQVFLGVVFLEEQARLALDAIVRTVVRVALTRRHLLEWETAATTERRLGGEWRHFLLSMWPAPVFAVAVGLAIGFVRFEALPAAVPVLLAWLVSPFVAFWVSRPRGVVELPLETGEQQQLRRMARKTWCFFETFAGADDHWLPPDNFQEDPKGVVAHRTSPTNIGLYLLSSVAAHDFGYLTLPALIERLEKTFDTLDSLERQRGHFYNWYDTQTMRALQPGYISTVDSGNLLGCLLALKQALREKIEEPVPEPALRDGLRDTLSLVRAELQALEPPAVPEPLDLFRGLDQTLTVLQERLQGDPGDLCSHEAWLQQMEQRAEELCRDIQRLAGALDEPPEELVFWAQRFADQVREQRHELAALAPWLDLVREEPRNAATDAALDKGGLAGRWRALRQRLVTTGSLADLQAHIDALLADLAILGQAEDEAGKEAQHAIQEDRYALSTIAQALQASAAAELLTRCQRLADRASALASEMDFRMLYNESRQLFSIGFNLGLNRLDNAHYDLLASEACLTSFLAIARGDVPKRHWFHLSRPLTRAGGSIALLSWGGTMFEYLMPRLLLRGYSGTLLHESCNAAVARQIEYGQQHRVPWGISESGFSALDVALDYQYQSFGVPGLGLKRGLGQNLVIAPYATALALAVRPHAALDNIRAFVADNAEGRYGLYEALDFTRDRMVEKRRPALVRSYMAHHQGMSLVAMANCLFGNHMVRRFHREPMVRATELLLQERVPSSAPLQTVHSDETAPRPHLSSHEHPMSRRVSTPHTPHPRIHLLSNRKYNVMVTNAGAGYSTWEDLDVTRWREDRTRDCYGQFCYVRDLRSGLLWSPGYQPVCRPADEYEAVYSTDKAEFRRFDGGIETHMEITVSAENAAEVRRITVTNHNPRSHDLELTSYAEIVLAPHGGDLAHPAFGKLFLETEFIPTHNALLCRRRPRSAEQKPIWAVHVVATDSRTVGGVQYETDRARFLGRGRTVANPAALERNVTLGGATGPVLDPIFSLRRRIQVAPGASVALAFTTAVADSRQQALALADQYHDFHGVNRAFELAWAHTQVELRHLRVSAEDLHLYQRLAAHIIYSGTALRVAAAVANNRQGQPALWRHGISGDRPIVLARIAEIDELPLVRQLLDAHSYWRLKGLSVDLVLLNEHPASYYEDLHQELQNLVRASDDHTLIDRPGGVFVRKAAQMSDEDKLLLQAAARVVLSGDRGSLAGQVDRSERAPTLPQRLTPGDRKRETDRERARENLKLPNDLLFPNGLGGFTPDGREYVIGVQKGPATEKAPLARRGGGEDVQLPPAPWINVIANPNCGFLISESGAGYTWVGNSQANRLTPWSNDPVSDPPGEVIYLRDEDSGEFWTPTPLPIPAAAPTIVRHGQGYTIFDRHSHGLSQELVLFVPPADPVKLIRLRLRNVGSRQRRLSATFYAEWVLGTVRDQAAMNVVAFADPETGAILARNAFNTDFAAQVAFADVSLRPCTCTSDRTEFLGRNGSVLAPAALSRVELSGRLEPTLDPCAALMAPFVLAPGADIEIVFLLGQATGQEEARRLLRRYRDPVQVEAAFKDVCKRWDQTLNAVQVRTPNPALDLLLNRWLLYQVLSCRVWGRSAFYQSGGAYGFRDQLQDVMALVHGAPFEERTQLLRAATRQFLEGDVQHWWHPPAGRGTRTRISDDLLWLPLVACHYANTTGDTAILDERLPFLRSPLLQPDQEEAYNAPETTAETATLYEHCIKALEYGMRFGVHGLPLMGTGDWNDGMNRVGAGGKGESVWNGWFLLTILPRMIPIVEAHGDRERAARYREQMERLRSALEEHAWDGRWYRRAYFDDGTPLGSAENDECKIDSLAQTWAVIAGVANPDRARLAMAAVEEYLVKQADKMILLFTPPFDQGKLHPGYIKGYVPGIRENGGQYTHAATWVVQATALLGQGRRAMELFDLLNPIQHAATPQDVARYKVEPYVVAADIYGHPPHTGRGGWTWYTGSAGWLYRVGLESILGFHREGNSLRLDPCIPGNWPRFELSYRFGSTTYHLVVENPSGVERGIQSVWLDDSRRDDNAIPLTDDGRKHEVRLVLGP